MKWGATFWCFMAGPLSKKMTSISPCPHPAWFRMLYCPHPHPRRLLRYGQERSLSFPGSAGVLPLRFGYHGDRLHGNPQLAFSRMGLDPSPPAGALPLRPWHLGRCVGGHSGSFLASTRLPWQEQRLLRVYKSPKVSIPPARRAPVGGPRMPHQSRPRSQNSHVEINCLWLLLGELPCWLHV